MKVMIFVTDLLVATCMVTVLVGICMYFSSCTYPPYKETRVIEIHNELVNPKPVPEPSPLDEKELDEPEPVKLHIKALSKVVA